MTNTFIIALLVEAAEGKFREINGWRWARCSEMRRRCCRSSPRFHWYEGLGPFVEVVPRELMERGVLLEEINLIAVQIFCARRE